MVDSVVHKTSMDVWTDPERLDFEGRRLCQVALSQVVSNFTYQYLPEEPRTVIEIGSGTGALDEHLHPYIPRTYLEGSPELVTIHRARLEKTGHDPEQVKAASLYELPFAGNSVDMVLGMLVLDAMFDMEGAFGEVVRVLRPDGVFVYFHDVRASTNAIAHLAQEDGYIPVPVLSEEGKITHLATLSPKEYKRFERKIIKRWGKTEGRRISEILSAAEYVDNWNEYLEHVQEFTNIVLGEMKLVGSVTPHLSDLLSSILSMLAEVNGMTVLKNEVVTATHEVDRQNVNDPQLDAEDNVIEHGPYGLGSGKVEGLLPGRVLTIANALCFAAKK